jgi:hypothetical protein
MFQKYRSEVIVGALSATNLWVCPILKEESGPFTSSHRCGYIIDLRKIIGRIRPVHNNTTEVEFEFRRAFTDTSQIISMAICIGLVSASTSVRLMRI